MDLVDDYRADVGVVFREPAKIFVRWGKLSWGHI